MAANIQVFLLLECSQSNSFERRLMKSRRRAGFLCSISSLPNTSGIGSLGPEAFEFAEFVKASGGSIWSWLPTTPLGYGNSPYSSLYTTDRNPLYISTEYLFQAGLLDQSDMNSPPGSSTRIDYDRVRAWKTPLLVKAADRFRGSSDFDEFGIHMFGKPACFTL
jgi:4-alpha-glucanotransferase